MGWQYVYLSPVKSRFQPHKDADRGKKMASMFFFQTFLNGGNLSYIIFLTGKFANETVHLKRFNITNECFMKLIHHLRHFTFF